MKITLYPDQEKSVLATCLVSKDAAYKVMQELDICHFTESSNIKIFRCINALYLRGVKINRDALKVESVNLGLYDSIKAEIALLTTYASLDNLDLHISLIKESHQKQRIAEVLSRLSNNLNELQIHEINEITSQFINNTEQETFFWEEEILNNFEDGSPLTEYLQKKQDMYRSGVTISGYETGLPSLDNVINGINKSHYIVIGGSPGSGKSTLAVQIVNHLEKQGKKIGIMSLELTKSQFVLKLLSLRTGVSYGDLQKGNIDSLKYQNCVEEIEKRRKSSSKTIGLEEIPIHSIASLRARIKRMVDVKKIDVLVVDYIGLIQNIGNSGTTNDKLAEISSTIREALKMYNIPGLILCQLNKKAGNEPPESNHIRDTNQITQDAHEILLLWDPDKVDGGVGGNRRKLFVRKSRFGPPVDIDLKFDGNIFYQSIDYNQITAQQIEGANDAYAGFIPQD